MISYKFVSLCLFLFVLAEASDLQLFSYMLGKRTGNKRILESTSKENFKVSYVPPKNTTKKKYKHKKKFLSSRVMVQNVRTVMV